MSEDKAERRWTHEDVEAAVEASTRASGVPLKVEDPAVLAKIAAIVRSVDRGTHPSTAPGPQVADP